MLSSSAGPTPDQPGAGQKPLSPVPRWTALFWGTLAALVILAAYRNSFSGAFVYDDLLTITDNPAIRHLGFAGQPPPAASDGGLPDAGRPLVHLSLALNYAVDGTAVRGYHALNLGIHLLAALALFGCVRRTLNQPRLRDRFVEAAAPLAFAIAGLWAIHPLQTESVGYVVQRAESLMGLCYLSTLYCFIRGTELATPGRWYALTVVACLAGMASKEVMVSAPLMVLLYDRTFVAGSFGEAWRRRGRLYAGLAATWLLLACLVVNAGSRGGTAGFATGVAWWQYAATQLWAIVHYLRLCVWPHPLIFDYGTEPVQLIGQILPSAVIVVLLLAVTVIALWRNSVIGFLGAWFFGILAPSSSVVPVVTEIAAEHRMYLPLAAIVTLLVIGLHGWIGRRSLVVCAVLAVAFASLTWLRNADYRSEHSIWHDTVAKRPGNARAHFNLGGLLAAEGRVPDAVAEFELALRIKPDFASAHSNLSNALLQSGDAAGARRHAEEALRLNPALAEAHNNLGNVFLLANDLTGALREYAAAVRLKPDDAEMHNNLGTALTNAGRLADAIGEYQASLKLKPDAPIAHFNLANTYARSGRLAEAIGEYGETLRLQADYPRAREYLNQVQEIQQASSIRH